MENSSENINSNSNILGTNQENLNEYPFKMITKEQEKKENPEINNIDKSENNLKTGENHKFEEDKHNRSEIERKTGNNNIKKATNLPIIKEYETQNKSKLKKKGKKISLNCLPPEVYMGKKMKHTESNINPIEIKLKRIEDQIKKQLDYDYKKTMKEIQDEFNNKKKNKEKQKHIQEEEQKLKEKLKSMEEFRENKLIEREKKVLIKQNRSIKNLQKIKSRNKLTNKEEQTHNNEDQDEVSNYSKKLPPLSTMPNERYNLILANKKRIEKDFINETLEILNNLDLDHKENYIYEHNKRNDKIKEQSKKYAERNELYAKNRLEKELAKNEKLLQKDISRTYNIRLAILRDRSEKVGRLKEQAKKKMESFQEKQEILEQKEKEKIKKIMGKINKKKNISNIYEGNKSKRQLFSNLQKENLNKSEKEKEQKYNDYLYDQEYYLGVAYDIQNEHNNKKMFQNIIDKHSENEKKYQDFYQFVDNSKKQDISLKPDKIKMKEYKKKIREEIEEKNRKEEEAMNK